MTWHVAQASGAWAPTSAKPPDTWTWSRVAPCHAASVWHVVQVDGKAAWFGCAAAASSAWQLWQSSGPAGVHGSAKPPPVPTPVWHVWQSSAVCAPRSGKPPESTRWSPVAPSQALTVWHCVQVVGKPVWSTGAAAASAAWHVRQSSWEAGWKSGSRPDVWHAEHGSASWAPTSANPRAAVGWSNGWPAKATVVWHVSQSVGKPAAAWSTAVAAVAA